VRGICDAMERRGWEVTRLPVYEDGVVRVEDVRAALRDDTVLVTVMLANNEIGTVQPVAEIGALVRERRRGGSEHLWLHTDAVQAASGDAR
jgi:cysteine desulfurase